MVDYKTKITMNKKNKEIFTNFPTPFIFKIEGTESNKKYMLAKVVLKNIYNIIDLDDGVISNCPFYKDEIIDKLNNGIWEILESELILK